MGIKERGIRGRTTGFRRGPSLYRGIKEGIRRSAI
jgi:hypothetical protein